MRRSVYLTVLASLAAALVTPASRADCPMRWSMYGHDSGRSMAQDCSSISLTNVSTLHPKWVFNTGSPVTAQPAVVDGTVYVGTAGGTFYALPADPGPGPVTPKWAFNVTDKNLDSYGKFVSSAAVVPLGGTDVVVVGGGSTLYALDGKSSDPNGTVLGSACVDPRATGRCQGSDKVIEIESSPVVVPVDDHTARIYVGMDFNETPGVGRPGLIRFTLSETGGAWSLHPDWKFDTEGLVTYRASDSADPDYIFTAGAPGQGCGNVWTSPMVANGLVYFDTSNCDTTRYKDTSLFGGESVMAVDAETGDLSWCYQPRHVNDNDADFGASPNLLPNGDIGVAGKDGNYYDLPATKEPTATPGTGEDACFGAKGQQPKWVTPAATGGSIDGFIGTAAVGKVNGAGAVFAANAIPMPDQSTFSNPQYLTTLHAIAVATGKVLWDAPNVLPTYTGPTYTNGVVFMPDTFGMNLSAYDADNGVPVWSVPLPAPASPPSIVGDSVYVGSGVFPGGDSPAPGLNTVLGALGAVYAFQAVVAPAP